MDTNQKADEEESSCDATRWGIGGGNQVNHCGVDAKGRLLYLLVCWTARQKVLRTVNRRRIQWLQCVYCQIFDDY